MNAKLVPLLACMPLLAGCTLRRTWASPGRPYGANFERGPADHPTRFQTDLTGCVAAHDPDHLAEIDAPEGYHDHGWFLSGRRESVAQCLRKKGWRDGPNLVDVMGPIGCSDGVPPWLGQDADKEYVGPVSDQPENLMLVYLRRIDERTDRIESDLRDVKRRMTSIEEQVANLYHSYAGLQVRFDRLENRIERIERRLDLTETTH